MGVACGWPLDHQHLANSRNFLPCCQHVTMMLARTSWTRAPFSVLISNKPVDLHLCATIDAFQSFSFYTYNEDGTNRRENITDWAAGEADGGGGESMVGGHRTAAVY